MSRAWFPRRFPVAIPMLVLALFAASATAVVAQDPATEPRATTIIGSDRNARLCSHAIDQGDISDLAIEHCERALEYQRLTRESGIQIRIGLGVLRLRRHDDAAALQQFEAVIALEPRNAEAHLNRGAALLQLRQYGPAIAAITEAMGLGVREPHKAYFNRGVAREALGDLRGAYEDYGAALAIQPDWGPASAELARFARQRRERLADALNEPARP